MLLGPVPGLGNYWLNTGSSIGLAWGPGAGRELARWMVHGETEFNLRNDDPRRYGWADQDYVRDKSIEGRAARYDALVSLNPIPVLLYHRVDHSGLKFSTSPETFEQHLAWLDDHGYQTLCSSELVRLLARPDAPKPEKAVVITFDDGFACLDGEVAPALRRHGYTGTAFVVTGRMDDGARMEAQADAPDGEVLQWEAARRLAGEGVLDFHSHTHRHRKWKFGSDEAATVADELATSRSILAQELGQPESQFDQVAWPYGRTCEAWESEARRLGIRTHYVVQRGAIDRHQCHRLPRLLVDGMQTTTLARWMNILTTPSGARFVNRVFGSIRHVRQGAGYL